MSFKERRLSRLFSFFPKLRLDQYLGFLLISFILLTLPIFWRNQQSFNQIQPEFNLVQIGAVPFLKSNLIATKQNLLDRVSAQNLLVIDIDSATTLLERNATRSAFPASTTKMMTALIAQERLDQEQILIVRKEDLINGNKVGFEVGEKIRVADLLQALLIGSSNEAAEILANGVEGGKEDFVNLMNQKARDLHLEQTLFVNPSGFDNENIYSTARDLGILARELMKDDFLRQTVAIKKLTFFDLNQILFHTVTNTNQLLYENDEVVGIKTGTTDGAGEVLITQVERQVGAEKRKIMIMILGSQDRYADTRVIIDWIFDSYDWLDLDLADFLYNE